MEKRITVLVVLVSSIFILIGPFTVGFSLLDGDFVYPLMYALFLVVLGFTSRLIWRKFFSGSEGGVKPQDSPSKSLRILLFIIILLALIYPAFFIEKGYFSANLVSTVDLLEIEQLDLSSDIDSRKDSIAKILSDIESAEELGAFSLSGESELKELKDLRRDHVRESSQLEIDSKKHVLNERRLSNLKARLDSLNGSGHYDNLYSVMRALCLGALGAMLTLLATSSIKSRKIPSYGSVFDSREFWPTLVTNCLAGSIVSVLAFSLMYTKQISIFETVSGAENSLPDYWRSTLLCLISGAFSEKIYEAVSSKVDNYVDSSDKENDGKNKKPSESV